MGRILSVEGEDVKFTTLKWFTSINSLITSNSNHKALRAIPEAQTKFSHF